jgi:hypothetical protein
VDVALPSVEVRFEGLHIETEVYAETGRQLPSLFNAVRGLLEARAAHGEPPWLHAAASCSTSPCCSHNLWSCCTDAVWLQGLTSPLATCCCFMQHLTLLLPQPVELLHRRCLAAGADQPLGCMLLLMQHLTLLMP